MKIVKSILIITLLLAKFSLFAANYHIETATIEEDRIEAEARPEIAYQIAEKWYERGEEEIALELDEIYLRDSSQKVYYIKEYDRRDVAIDVLAAFEKLYPSLAMYVFTSLINSGNFAEAEAYGNKMLEYWVSQGDNDIREYIDYKVLFAINAGSEYYYNLLKDKLIFKDKIDVRQNYSKFFENVPLNPNSKDISITEYLSHRTYINPDFLKNFNITIEEARKLLETDLYELAKKSDITFSLLHAIALHAKSDPYFRLDIFYESPILDYGYTGTYKNDLKRVDINSFPLRSKLIRGLISHEWTHQLMDILFDDSSCNPYPKEDNTAKAEWEQIMEGIWKRLYEVPRNLKSMSSWDLNINAYERMLTSYHSIISFYAKCSYDAEAIARFSETIGADGFEDPKVKEFLQPIYDYWMKYIEPAINKYIQNHAKEDTFVSDWERENILDPFYRAEFDSSDEYKSDLRICKGQPKIAKSLGDKWFDRGDKEIAVEFHRIFLQHSNDMADEIANQWYDRGEKEIALEFDKIAVKRSPLRSEEIAHKWYKRGEKEIAIEFDKAYVGRSLKDDEEAIKRLLKRATQWPPKKNNK